MDELERLRIEVQDERARRRWAERELAAEVDKRSLWRKRAEERKARIRLLEERLVSRSQSQSILERLKRLVRSGRPTPRDGAPAAQSARPRAADSPALTPQIDRGASSRGAASSGAFVAIRAAVLGGEDIAFLEEFEAIDLADNADALFDSDFVFVSVAAVAEAAPSLCDAIDEWLDLAGRQPLVAWVGDEPSPVGLAAKVVENADVSLGRGVDREFPSGFLWSGIGSTKLPDTADANPAVRVFTSDSGVTVAVAAEPGMAEPRVAGLMAAGVPVVTLGSEIEPHELAASLFADPDLAGRLAVVARRRAWREHSPARRAEALVARLGMGGPVRSRQIGALLLSNKPDLVLGAVETVLSQQHVDVLPVVGLHGDRERFEEVRPAIVAKLAGRPHVLLDFDTSVPLGDAMNRAANACSSPVLAKMDDDDWYGPHYLEDALYALQYSGADLVGKAKYYVAVEESGEVFLVDGPEEGFSNHVIGSSLVFRRRLWEDVPFPCRPSRVDSIFLRGVRAHGGSIYSNSRYEFAVRRRTEGHTWVVDPAHFAARGTRVGSSLVDVAVNVPDSLLEWPGSSRPD